MAVDRTEHLLGGDRGWPGRGCLEMTLGLAHHAAKFNLGVRLLEEKGRLAAAAKEAPLPYRRTKGVHFLHLHHHCISRQSLDASAGSKEELSGCAMRQGGLSGCILQLFLLLFGTREYKKESDVYAGERKYPNIV